VSSSSSGPGPSTSSSTSGVRAWVNFRGSCNGKGSCILRPLGKYFRQLVYIFLWPFGNLVAIFGIMCQQKFGNPVKI
jgi:hypothetical protein